MDILYELTLTNLVGLKYEQWIVQIKAADNDAYLFWRPSKLQALRGHLLYVLKIRHIIDAETLKLVG